MEVHSSMRYSIVAFVAVIGSVGCSDSSDSSSDCDSDDDCAGGAVCWDRSCVQVECTTPSTCPGTDDDCQTRTCQSGHCVMVYAASGTAVASQTKGDCRTVVCDGNGETRSDVDDDDVPESESCRVASCNDGTSTQDRAPEGTSCGAGLTCDGEGKCVGCSADEQCDAPAGPCARAICDEGVCRAANVEKDTPVADDTGNCKKSSCDGNGDVVTANDDTDLPPDDGNECTVAACHGGDPVHDNVVDGTACGDGNRCHEGVCSGPCSESSDCGADTDCATYKCVSNLCGVDYAVDGTPAEEQTPGDCKKSQCDGNGNVVTANDDTDLPPDDGSECTVAACHGGDPVHDNVVNGTACGDGNMCHEGVCGAACSEPSDCGPDTDCKTYKCVSNLCGVDYAADGTPAGTQTPGDCEKSQCDGNGSSVTVDDDTDPPDDGNECTNDVCIAGVPSHPPKSAGTSCTQEGGRMCDGAGECVECVDVGDCLAAANQCQLAECTAGICDVTYLELGPAPTGQIPGNCKALWCDGEGNVEEVNEDTNEPPPTDCSIGVCQAGDLSWIHNAGSPCDAGAGVCDGDGQCVYP